MAHDKRLKAGYATFDRSKSYALDEAITMVRANAKAKFDETVELTMNLGIDPRHADQMVRGLISLPNGTGKTLRVGVFARGAKAEEALAAGADVVGAEDLAERVQAGEFGFDRCIAARSSSAPRRPASSTPESGRPASTRTSSQRMSARWSMLSRKPSRPAPREFTCRGLR